MTPVFDLELVDPTATFDALTVSDAPLRKFELMTMEQIIAVYNNASAIKKIITDCGQYLLEQAAQGTEIPGMKLVQGRQGNRRWGNEGEVREKLLELVEEETIEVRKLKSFNQISEVLAGAAVPKDIIDAFNKMTVRSEGKIKLVPENDKRKAIGNAVDIFELIQNEDDYADTD